MASLVDLAGLFIGGMGAKAGYDIQKETLELQKKEQQDRALDEARRVMQASEEAALRGYSTDVDERLATAKSDLGTAFLGRDRQIQDVGARRRGAAVGTRAGATPIVDQYRQAMTGKYAQAAQGPSGSYSQYVGGGGGGLPTEIAAAMAQGAGRTGTELGQRADIMGNLAGTRKMDELTQTMGDTIARADTGELTMRGAGKEDLGIAEQMLGDEQTKMSALIDRRKNVLDRKYGTTGAAIRQGVNTANPWKYASQVVGSLSNLQDSSGKFDWGFG